MEGAESAVAAAAAVPAAVAAVGGLGDPAVAVVELVSSRGSSSSFAPSPWISALCRTLSGLPGGLSPGLSPDPSVLEAESEVPFPPPEGARVGGGEISSAPPQGVTLTRVTRFNPGGRRWWRL